jgi:hypothetical protein
MNYQNFGSIHPLSSTTQLPNQIAHFEHLYSYSKLNINIGTFVNLQDVTYILSVDVEAG